MLGWLFRNWPFSPGILITIIIKNAGRYMAGEVNNSGNHWCRHFQTVAEGLSAAKAPKLRMYVAILW